MNECINECVINFIEKEALSRVVALEGPPIYLWPTLPTQQWHHPAFVGGWQLLDTIKSNTSAIPDSRSQHWVLVDDFNYRPPDVGQVDGVGETLRIANRIPALADLSLFTSIPLEFSQGRGYFESDFIGKSADISCSQLDSGFQIRKLTSALLHNRENLITGNIKPAQLLAALEPLPLVIMVHPRDFWGQQEAMLGRLLGRMKERPFIDNLYNKIPGVERRRIIETSYLHIWMNSDGKVEAVTSPRWSEQKNGFKHQPRIL